ncbi:MAG: hypothetical protein II616_03635, partial [Bacteroidales bacterium]|nr:hypothetical protein [Bacteroidales bacterium]
IPGLNAKTNCQSNYYYYMKKYLSPVAEMLAYKEAQPLLDASGTDYAGDISDLELVEDTWD